MGGCSVWSVCGLAWLVGQVIHRQVILKELFKNLQ